MDINTLKTAQNEAFQTIDNAFRKTRLSHAYIFEGDAGTMKLDAALFFAAKHLCQAEDKPCYECHNCKRVIHRTHPNLYIVQPEKTMIVKDDILNLQREFSKTSLEAGAKIYIIEAAETMNVHAQNTLLKFLEEPHMNIYGILITTDSGKLLPTIRSRSQMIHFHKLPETAIEKALLNQGYPQWQSRLGSRIYPTVQDAEQGLNESDLDLIYDGVKTVYESLLEDKSPLLVFQKHCDAFLNDKNQTETLLDIFTHYHKDLIYDKINNRHQVIFAEDINTIESIASRMSLSALTDILERLLVLNTRKNQFINMRLAFDNLMLALERGVSNEE